jgi:hypothetical protein
MIKHRNKISLLMKISACNKKFALKNTIEGFMLFCMKITIRNPNHSLLIIGYDTLPDPETGENIVVWILFNSATSSKIGPRWLFYKPKSYHMKIL